MPTVACGTETQVPMICQSTCTEKIFSYMHYAFSLLFFTAVGLMSLFLFTKSKKKRRNIVYRTCAILIFFSVFTMVILFLIDKFCQDVLPFDRYSAIFWLEPFAVWMFALAWLVKGIRCKPSVAQ